MAIPNYQDRVKHRTASELVIGTVIAKYRINRGLKEVENKKAYFEETIDVLDVRSDDDKIYYSTPAKNWETIMTEEESNE